VLLAIGEAAEYSGISIDTLRRWEKKARVAAYRSPGNHRYFKKEDLDKLFDSRYQRDTKPAPYTKTKKERQTPVSQTDSDKFRNENPLVPQRRFPVVDSPPFPFRPAKAEVPATTASVPDAILITQVPQQINKSILETPTINSTKDITSQTSTKKAVTLSQKQAITIVVLVIVLITIALLFLFSSTKTPEIISPIP